LDECSIYGYWIDNEDLSVNDDNININHADINNSGNGLYMHQARDSNTNTYAVQIDNCDVKNSAKDGVLMEGSELLVNSFSNIEESGYNGIKNTYDENYNSGILYTPQNGGSDIIDNYLGNYYKIVTEGTSSSWANTYDYGLIGYDCQYNNSYATYFP